MATEPPEVASRPAPSLGRSPAEPRQRLLWRDPIGEVRRRRATLAEAATLDPERDAHRIVQLLFGRSFSDPLFIDAVFTIVYWRQLGVPSIARILHRTGQTYDTRKRVNDTLLTFGFWVRDGAHTQAGGETADRIAAIHEHFNIRASDFRFTGACVCFEPVRVAETVGVKGLTPAEERAWFLFWRSVFRRWGIEIPEEQDEFMAWMRQYEDDEFAYTVEAAQMATALGNDFCKRFYPGPLKPLGLLFLRALCEDRLLDCLGQRRPTKAGRKAVALVVWSFITFRRMVPACSTDRFLGQWDAEYGPDPDPAEVGPKWASDVTAATRRHATVGR